MKTYWIVVLSCYTTAIATMTMMNVGQMSAPSSMNTWSLPVTGLVVTIIPALLGYLIGKESS